MMQPRRITHVMLLLAGSGVLGALRAQGALDVLRESAQPQGFERALAPRPFVFPADYGAHPGFRHEWWYVTGNLQSDAGERFGFELTFFRVALAPPAAAQAASAAHDPRAAAPEPSGQVAPASAWRTTQLYSAHFAITDVARQQFRFAQKSSRGALGLADAVADPFAVWVADWRLEARGADRWQLQAHAQGYRLQLEATVSGPPVPNGERGLSRKSNEAASYYYSIPRISVRGRLVRAGVPQAVHGLAWLDREWGSGVLAADEQGWDWYALQLDDGSSVMFYGLRLRDGTLDAHSAGTWIDRDGHTSALARDDVQISVTRHWRSPGGVVYPAGWQLSIPSRQLRAEVRPVLADQELRTQPRYWEGAVDVHARRNATAIEGRGYVELVGYGP